MQRIVAMLLAALLLVPAGSFAQGASPDSSRTIGRISTTAFSAHVPRPSANREVSWFAARLPAVPAQPQSVPRRSWAGRHPVLIGTLVGAGIGGVARARMLGLPWDTCFYDSETTGCGVASSAIGAGVGAGFGALVGLVVSLARR
jgi:hypothetical protein